jgi:hypothetical protein
MTSHSCRYTLSKYPLCFRSRWVKRHLQNRISPFQQPYICWRAFKTCRAIYRSFHPQLYNRRFTPTGHSSRLSIECLATYSETTAISGSTVQSPEDRYLLPLEMKDVLRDCIADVVEEQEIYHTQFSTAGSFSNISSPDHNMTLYSSDASPTSTTSPERLSSSNSISARTPRSPSNPIDLADGSKLAHVRERNRISARKCRTRKKTRELDLEMREE